MTSLIDIFQKVEAEQKMKSDAIMNLQSVIPVVGENGVKLKIGRKTEKQFTQTGLTSFLNRLNIPGGFFNKSSKDLQAKMLEEHFPKKNNQNVILRSYGDKIRFVGSNKYSTFDDINIIQALHSSKDLEGLRIKQFHQNEEHLVLRMTTEEPIPGLRRPFYPGIQIYNSEVGKSSVKIQFFLYEEVCTNGMVVNVGTFDSYNRKHIGKISEFQGKLAVAADEMISRIPEFIEASSRHLGFAAKLSVEEMTTLIEKDKRIPKKIKESMSAYLPNYLGEDQSGNGLDVVSSFTEAIQTYDWDARNTYEQIAGEYVWQ